MRMGLSRTGVSFQQVPWRFFFWGGGWGYVVCTSGFHCLGNFVIICQCIV